MYFGPISKTKRRYVAKIKINGAGEPMSAHLLIIEAMSTSPSEAIVDFSRDKKFALLTTLALSEKLISSVRNYSFYKVALQANNDKITYVYTIR